jgi:hypothetical protein
VNSFRISSGSKGKKGSGCFFDECLDEFRVSQQKLCNIIGGAIAQSNPDNSVVGNLHPSCQNEVMTLSVSPNGLVGGTA